ncbi:MAG: hypothetical protein ABI921_06235 [Panacibacter sp.]
MKPSGKLTMWSAARNFGYQRKFSGVKDEIEKEIVSGFIKLQNKASDFEIKYTRFEQLKENDFDFLIFIGDQKAYFELTEMTPLDIKNGFAKASELINVYDYARKLFDLIQKKNQHYSIKTPIDLLVYITDYRAFIPSDALILIKYFLQKSSIIFRNIFFYAPYTEDAGVLKLLYPNNESLNINPESYKNRIVNFPTPIDIPSFPLQASDSNDKTPPVFLFHLDSRFTTCENEIMKVKEKIEDLKKVLETNLHEYLNDLLGNLNSLGMLYHEAGEIENSEIIYKEAFALIQLYIPADGSYIITVGTLTNNYAYLLLHKRKFQEAKNYAITALKLRHHIYKSDPTEFENFADSYTLVGLCFESLNDEALAEKNYTYALSILLNHTMPGDLQTDYKTALGFYAIALMYVKYGVKENTDSDFRESVNILIQITDAGFDKGFHDLAVICYDYALFLKKENRKEKAIELFNQALKYYEILEAQFPDIYRIPVAQTKGHLLLFT